MFGKMMNSFYYGKSGKGDFRKEDLPKNRWQLFWEMLRVRLSAICRLNLMTVVCWLPLIVVVASFLLSTLNTLTMIDTYQTNGDMSEWTEDQLAVVEELVTQPAMLQAFIWEMLRDMCLKLIPCILITGVAQVGMASITRNWARDEHAFIWSDFKDAVKANWKQGLGVSAITSVVPLVLVVCWQFYGNMAAEQMFFVVPQMLTLTLGLIWALGVTFMYPLIVSYEMKFMQVVKNGLLMGIARLPQTVGVRLAVLAPMLLVGLISFFTPWMMYALMALAGYYLIIGYALVRFVFASFTNSVFDRFINSRIEGAVVNRGLSTEDDDEDEDAAQTTESL